MSLTIRLYKYRTAEAAQNMTSNLHFFFVSLMQLRDSLRQSYLYYMKKYVIFYTEGVNKKFYI